MESFEDYISKMHYYLNELIDQLSSPDEDHIRDLLADILCGYADFEEKE